MPDGGGVDFAVRLNNQVTGPARQIKSAMADVKKAFESTKRAMEAPAPRRAGKTDWEKMTGRARASQAVDFAKQTARSAKLAANARIKEDKRVADFKKSTAQAKLDKQGGLVDLATGGLKFGVAAVGAAAFAAAAGVAYLGVKFTETAVAAAAFSEKSRLALTLLTGDAAVANREFDALRKEAAGLGLDVEETQKGFQKLLAAQFSIGKSKELLRMGADLQAIGADSQQVSRAILAISQIKNTGYLQGDELNQLREAGVSTELIYKALGKRMNKTTAQIVKMQEKRQLLAEPVIESILEAVRQKTGSSEAGEAGKKFAQSTLIGMMGVLKGNFQNLFIDVGDAMLPGLTSLMKLVTNAIGGLMKDPRIAAFGRFLLREFEYFVLWAEANWPEVSAMLTNGLVLLGDTIRFTFGLVDTATWQGKVFAGVMGTLAIALGLVAIAGFVLMLPLYVLVGVIGLVAYGIYKAIAWIVDALNSLPGFSSSKAPGATPGLDTFTAAIPGVTALSDATKITTAADTGAATKVPGLMSGLSVESVTAGGEPQAPVNSKVVNMNGWNVGSGIDQAELMAKVRSAVRKELDESATGA